MKKLVLVFCGLVLFAVFYVLCLNSAEEVREYYGTEDSSSTTTVDANILTTGSIEEQISDYVKESLTSTIKITAVGDIMVYDYQTKRAYDESDGSIDFSPSFTYISKYFDDSSYVLGNLEGTMAGYGNGAGTNDYGYWADTSTMNFNIPEVLADALVDAGFDMLTTANNHLLDSGIEGIASTISYITAAGLEQTGSFAEETDTPYVIKNIDGINVGILAYTNLLNDELDEAYSYAVNYLEDYSETKISEMCAQISEMKTAGADFIVISLHFGEEYETEVSDEERDLAERLVEAGADVIFGSYPHVVKPMEVIETTDSDGNSHTGLVFYALGNFLSAMQYKSSTGYDRDLGAIASLTITKDINGVTIDSVEIIPTYIDYTTDDIAIIPVCEAVDNPDLIADRLEADSNSYLDEARLAVGYTSVIETIISDTGLSYTYSDYRYIITFDD